MMLHFTIYKYEVKIVEVKPNKTFYSIKYNVTILYYKYLLFRILLFYINIQIK